MENDIPPARTIQPGETVQAYLVLSVRQLREILQRAETAAEISRPDGKGLSVSCVVLDIDVDTDQLYRSRDGAYNGQLSDETRERFLSRQFKDDSLAAEVRWTPACPKQEA